MSKGQLNKDAETETYTSQENGTLQKSSLQTANKSPKHKVNSVNTQSVDKRASTADSEDAGHQHSTLTTPQVGQAQPSLEASKMTSAEEDKAAEEEKCLNGTPAVVCTEPPTLSEINPKQEHNIMDAINNNNEECQVPHDICVNEPSTESAEVKEEVELLNAEPAAPFSQVLPISEINEEVNTEPCNSVNKDDPESRSSPVCVEEAQSHVPESSVGSVCSGFDHSNSGAEGETASSDQHTTAAAEESQSSQLDEKCDVEGPVKDASEETAVESPEEDVKLIEEAPGVVCEEIPKETVEKTEEASPEVVIGAEEVIVVSSKLELLAESPSTAAEGDTESDETPLTSKEEEAEDLANSEEDLYRGAEELSAELTTTAGTSSLSETSLRLEDRCSLAPAVDILSYSEREWKGNTAKSALIRKGYKDMSLKFSSVRRVRGDNYCALRATLYQVLCHATQMPEWLHEESVTMLPKELEAQEGLISQWIFPGECLRGDGTVDATQQLQGYMELLREKWQAAVSCASPAERQQLCEQWFQGGEQELGLMEALKLLMLARAVELHASIQKGDDPPLFCWLLFARDSSDCPRSFLNNHLSHVGLSAGLEQVEMFLLGHALQCTIQVYRLYKADTEEFVTFYPDDHKDEWPCVCLVTEDDRHYNVPVLLDAADDPPKELKNS
uniref:OTU deubiquitinase with linear linkage specificity a n=1 Tax=Neogobius melanostomus TaxID=47308 RepID=A0A8C6UUY9_9GOBI